MVTKEFVAPKVGGMVDEFIWRYSTEKNRTAVGVGGRVWKVGREEFERLHGSFRGFVGVVKRGEGLGERSDP